MAYQLAEAICELAAPPLQPSWIKLEAVDAGQCLVLHVRPRPHSAGLEVAAYAGWVLSNDWEDGFDLIGLRRRGALYALPGASSAGLAEFAGDLLAAGPSDTSGQGEPLPGFVLPQRAKHYMHPSWVSARCGLYDPADVQPVALPPEDTMGYSAVLRFPPEYTAGGEVALALASCGAFNPVADYVNTQQARRYNKSRRESDADSTAAVLPEPDSQEEYERTYRQLRGKAMAELAAALVTMLRHAARYRGTTELPPPPPLPAPAAAGAQAGKQGAV